MEDRAGKLRHLQLCAISAEELRQALLHAARHGHPLTTLVSHRFELATRDGLRPNRTLCRRFYRLCAFVVGAPARRATVHFADLYDLLLVSSAVPLPPQNF